MEMHVCDPVTNLLANVAGARIGNAYDEVARSLSRSVYTFASLLSDQTLGEEFCDLLPVCRGNPWQPIGLLRKFFLAVLCGFEVPGLLWLFRRLFPQRPAEDSVEIVSKVVLCFLMLFETFGTLRHRLLRVRYLSLRPPIDLRQGDGARYKFLIPGLCMALTLLIQLYQHYRSRISVPRGVVSDAAPPLESTDTDEDASSEEVKCMICYAARKNPTCTPCGHVFCWSCIAECTQKDSRCPLCRHALRLPALVPLFFYKPKTSPRLGTE